MKALLHEIYFFKDIYSGQTSIRLEKSLISLMKAEKLEKEIYISLVKAMIHLIKVNLQHRICY